MGIGFESLIPLVTRAMEASAHARVGFCTYRWNVAGNCQSPHGVDLCAHKVRWRMRPKAAIMRALGPEWTEALHAAGFVAADLRRFLGMPLMLQLDVRCRKCPKCLAVRRKLWERRAVVELKRAARSWFATYTLSPHEHFNVLMRASEAERKRGNRFEELSEDEVFRARCSVLGTDLTRYVKRVRKESGARLRYLFVTERHQSGLPHLHALWHEVSVDEPLRKRVLKEQWVLGHSSFKLVTDLTSARYLCKYLAKEQATRVRGSLAYGVEDGCEALHKTSSDIENGCNPFREKRTPTPTLIAV